MNIVRLEHEQQTAVINNAVNILRTRILGKILRIEIAQQEFLALVPGDEVRELPQIQPHHTNEEKDKIIMQ